MPIIEEASHDDDTRARVLCAGLEDGEITLCDTAYVNCTHLYDLGHNKQGIRWQLWSALLLSVLRFLAQATD